MCALLPNGSYFMPYWKFHWTSLLLQQDKFLDAHTHPQNVCALLIRLTGKWRCLYWLDESFVCVCVSAQMYVFVLDVVQEFICSRQYHIDQRFTYELYGAVKGRRRRGEPLISPFSSFFSTTPNFPPPPEFSLL